jgi:hypothetical protein
MKKLLIAAALLAPSLGHAQTPMPGHDPAMMHHMMQHGPGQAAALPTQPGQSAFAAIQEIVAMLEADPKTDWSRVNIEALRQHLIDMDNVTLRATVAMEPIEGGARFTVTGAGPVTDSIRRMVTAHAATMSGTGGWTFVAMEVPDGAVLTVTVGNAADVTKLRSLGFIGVMTRGMHHQMHHLMLASGENPHQ